MYMLCCVGYLKCITHYNRWKNGSPVSWVLVTMTFTSLAAFISKIIKTKRTVCSLPKGLINLTQAAQCTLYKDVCVFGLIVVIVKNEPFQVYIQHDIALRHQYEKKPRFSLRMHVTTYIVSPKQGWGAYSLRVIYEHLIWLSIQFDKAVEELFDRAKH